MHNIAVMIGPGAVWMFLYKEEAGALKVLEDFENAEPDTIIQIKDDFGTTGRVRKTAVHGILYEDIQRTALSGIERSLHTARTNARLQQMANTDPTLKMAAMMNGPNMVSPSFHPGGHPGGRQ